MKKLFALALALLSVSNFIFAQTSVGNFRGFDWGTPSNVVESSERAKFLVKTNDGDLEYRDNLAGYTVNVIYSFNSSGKLIGGMYEFKRIYSDPELYVQDYNKFKDLLIEKYGKPQLDKENWSTTSNQDIKENYGQFIIDRVLSLYTVWNTDKTIVKLVLAEKDRNPNMRIHYTAKPINIFDDKEAMERALNKL